MDRAEIERSRQLAALLESGLDVPAADVRAHLARQCDDPALVAEAVTLLRQEDDTADVIPAALPGARSLLASLDPGLDPPKEVGPYRVVRPIGEGGMGVVYEAMQSKPIKRRVALKLVRTSLATADERSRFRTEQQALARLSHPNIAPMYDAGVTSDGRPYFVMELVEGEPITTYCDRRRLSVAARLRLFVAVCSGIEHAHRRQLLHRDLKPSNVLMTDVEGEPVPKIIDFGIAKLLDADADLTHTATRAGSILGTPTFMSPEALAGLDLDTRVDVYTLGVLLYELLAGGGPFDDPSANLMEILARVRDQEPPPPSQRLGDGPQAVAVADRRSTTPQALRRVLTMDLDWIVARAMAKDRSARYDSAASLGDDVRRFLVHVPVSARPSSLGYRLRKGVHRHRTATAAATLALVAIIVAIGLGVRYTAEVQRERRNAEAARHQAEQLVTFLLDDLYQELEPFARRDFLGRVAAQVTHYFEALPPSLREASAVRHAQAARNLGRVKLQQGDFVGAREAYEAAMALDEGAVAQGGGTLALEGLALDHRRMADALERSGERTAVLASVQRALALRRRLLDAEPGSVRYREAMAWDLSELGWAHRDLDDLAAAVRAFEQSVTLRRALQAADPRPAGTKWLGATLKDLASTLAMHGRPAAGRPFAEEAVTLLGSLVEVDPRRIDFVAEAGEAWRSLSTVQRALGEVAASRAAQEKALDLFQRWTESDPSDTRGWQHLASSRIELASLLRQQGHDAQATRQLTLAYEGVQGLPRELPVAVVEAHALLELGRVDEARAPAARVVAAGWYETRPRLEALLREAGLLQ